MHFAAWLSVGDSVTDPAGYYRNNVAGSIGLLDGLCRAGVTRLIFSSTCATYGEPQRVPIDETHPQQPINAYGETKLAVERALPHFETAYGLRSIALRYFNAAGADPDGLLGEDHDPGDPHHPARHLRGQGHRHAQGVRRGLPDAGRHLPARLHPRHRPGRRARPRPGVARTRRPVGPLQRRHGHAAFGEGSHRRRRPRRRAGPCPTRSAPAGPATRRRCTPRTGPSAPRSAGRPGMPISTPSWGPPGAGSRRTPTATATEVR